MAIAAGNQAEAAKTQVEKLDAGVQQTSKLASAAGKANEIAQQAIEIQTRPWINVPGRIDNLGTIVLRNFGRSPAIIMQPRFVLANIGKPQIFWWDYSLKDPNLCAQFGDRFKTPVFPDELRPIRFDSFDAESNQQKLRHPPYLSGCIVYFNPAGGGPYKTKFVYSIIYEDDSSEISSIELRDVQTQ